MNRKILINVVISVLLVSLLIGVFGCVSPASSPAASSPTTTPVSAQVIRWRGENTYPYLPDQLYSSGQRGVSVVEWIKRATGGRLLIDLQPPGAIVAVPDIFDAVSKGTLQFAGMNYAGNYAGKFPETDVESCLPLAWQDCYDSWEGFNLYGIAKELEKIYAGYNLKYFPSWCDGSLIIGTNFPIASLDDLKGKKLRANGIFADLASSLGASPVSIPFAETYMAQKLGTIDGAILGASSLEDVKMKEVWKYCLVDPIIAASTGNYLINMNAWNALPADIKEIIEMDITKPDLMSTAMSYVDRRLLFSRVQKENGIKLVRLSDSDKARLVKLASNTWDKVAAKSPRCASMVDAIKKQMRALGRIE